MYSNAALPPKLVGLHYWSPIDPIPISCSPSVISSEALGLYVTHKNTL